MAPSGTGAQTSVSIARWGIRLNRQPACGEMPEAPPPWPDVACRLHAGWPSPYRKRLGGALQQFSLPGLDQERRQTPELGIQGREQPWARIGAASISGEFQDFRIGQNKGIILGVEGASTFEIKHGADRHSSSWQRATRAPIIFPL